MPSIRSAASDGLTRRRFGVFLIGLSFVSVLFCVMQELSFAAVGAWSVGSIPRARSSLVELAGSSNLTMIFDRRTGARLAIPTELLATQSPAMHGTNWEAPDKSLSIDVLDTSEYRSLPVLYRKLRGIAGREHSVDRLSETSFSLWGYMIADESYFIIEGRRKDGLVRALSIVYSKKGETHLRAIAEQIVASFDPFASGDPVVVAEGDTEADAVAVEPAPPPKLATAPPVSALEVPSVPTANMEALFWDSIKNSTNPDEFRAYLQQFPHGVFEKLARSRLATLITSQTPKAADVQTISMPPVDTVAAPDPRAALVVGIDDYQSLPRLQKAANDAAAVSRTLKELGFEVMTLINPKRGEFLMGWQEYLNGLPPGALATVFFACHGVEVDGSNYVLMADTPKIKPNQKQLLEAEGMNVSKLILDVKEARPRFVLFILDACRNNPFASPGSRSIGGARGLANISGGDGVFIMYSAGFGQTALDRLMTDDGTEPNSVYTRHLVPLLKTRGITIRAVATEIREKVRLMAASESHEQVPAYYDEIIGEPVCLAGGCTY